jgi:two-component system sensor histidine kinase/response regulator
VADDNAHARIVIADMLRSLSCLVTAVDSGEEALVRARQAEEEGRPFKLAVLDWKMPGLDGAETAQLLSKAGDLSVILVTAYDREDAMRRAERAGIQVVLHKPVSPSTLHDAVVRVLHPAGGTGTEYVSAPPRRFASGQRVLVVEDNAINREVAREMLSLAGLDVTEAHNGLDALRILDEKTFDLVMMDVQMPELDGIETVRAIRSIDHLRTLPVIAITAHAMLGDRERFIEAGMSDYVSKPIDETQLMKVLGRFLVAAEEGAPHPGPVPVPRAEGVLDVAAGVRQASGNAALYERLLQRFSDENENTVAQLRDIVSRGQREEALRLLHTLKGSAATLGARELADAAAILEIALRKSNDVVLDDLARALDAFRAAAARIPIRAYDGGNGRPAATLEEVKPLLDRLAQLLPQNNLGALECFQELKKLVGSTGAVESLEDALDRLDFRAAIPHLKSLELELGAPS